MVGKLILTALFVAASILNSCAKPPARSGEPPAAQFSVATQTVAEESAAQYVELTGSIEGRLTVPVASKLMSQVLYMGYEEGERVSKGDVLARLDDSEIAALQLEAAAYRAEATAALGEVEAGVTQGQAAKAQAEAALAQAVASSSDAMVDAERYRKLAEAGVVAPIQAEKYELASEVAIENVKLAEAAVEQAQGAIDQARARGPQVMAKQDQAAARGAQAASMLEYSVLTAPIDGVVTRRLADPGQLSIPGQPLYLLADDSGFQVRVNAPERVSRAFQLGDEIEVLLNTTGSTRSLQGTISVINGAVDPATHTVGIEVTLPPDPGLVSGMFARVLIPAGEAASLLIPDSALVRDGDISFVWRVSVSGMLSQAPVEVSPHSAGMLLVVKGLRDGDRIVIEPQDELFPGARIETAAGGS